MTPVFIVGTGRCGSTLLSEFLAAHPAILSLSELLVFLTDLGGRIDAAFPEGLVDGEAAWRLLAGVYPRQTLMLRHDVMMDEALYRPGPGRRFDRTSGVPAVAATTLPHLGGDPDEWFDRLESMARGLPPAPWGETFSALFGRLCEARGARIWVERSGGSLRVVERLLRHFPGARFVHIVRDGRDTAVSMSRHRGFRLALAAAQITEILGVDPYESSDRTWEADLPDDLVPYLPERFDAARFRDEVTPLPLCGMYWSGEILAGVGALASLPSERLLTLRYEAILEDPRAEVGRLFRFLLGEDVEPDLDAAAARVRRPRSDWRTLPEREREELESACAPGMAALKRWGFA